MSCVQLLLIPIGKAVGSVAVPDAVCDDDWRNEDPLAPTSVTLLSFVHYHFLHNLTCRYYKSCLYCATPTVAWSIKSIDPQGPVL